MQTSEPVTALPYGNGLVDDLFRTYLIRDIELEKRVISLLDPPSNAQRKNLLIANAYLCYSRQKDPAIYQSLHAESGKQEKVLRAGLNTYVTLNLKKDVARFSRGLFGANPLPRNTPLDIMLQDIVTDILHFDFRRYFNAIREISEYSILAICDNLLLLPERAENTRYLSREIPQRVQKLEGIVNRAGINVEREGLHCLTKLGRVPDLQ